MKINYYFYALAVILLLACLVSVLSGGDLLARRSLIASALSLAFAFVATDRRHHPTPPRTSAAHVQPVHQPRGKSA